MSLEIATIIIVCLLGLLALGVMVVLGYEAVKQFSPDPLEEAYKDYLVPVRRGVKEWEDHYPSIDKLNSMREEYPALDSAFKKFKTSYNLVVNDWESKRIEDE